MSQEIIKESQLISPRYCAVDIVENWGKHRKTNIKVNKKADILQDQQKERESMVMVKAKRENWKEVRANEVRKEKDRQFNELPWLVIRNLCTFITQLCGQKCFFEKEE